MRLSEGMDFPLLGDQVMAIKIESFPTSSHNDEVRYTQILIIKKTCCSLEDLWGNLFILFNCDVFGSWLG